MEAHVKHKNLPLRELVDLTDPAGNVAFNMSLEEGRDRVASGTPDRVHEIDGHFAIVARDGNVVRMARSLAIPLQYSMARRGS